MLRYGDRLVAQETGDSEGSLRGLYHATAMDHPKFHKMDLCSKAALLVVEHPLNKAREVGADLKERTGLLAINSTGCRATDGTHWQTLLEHGTASPGIFVYTLANIPNGEIGIRHGMHGPAICLQTGPIRAEDIVLGVRLLMERHGMQHVICYRSDIFADRYTARAALIGKEGEGVLVDPITLSNTIVQDDPWIPKH
ncbi:MAG: hypothetical protein KDB88_01350 [Flavobacteriales bacterium]|nr:hypothetical protein [Flavobacteriales bacterium]